MRRLLLTLPLVLFVSSPPAIAQCPAQIPESQQLLPANGDAVDLFGISAAISGDWIAVGASWDSDHGDTAGEVWVWRRDGDSWVPEGMVIGDDTVAGDRFGTSVALDGDILVVGAWRAHAPLGDSGAAYVFRWSGSAWVQEAKLVGSDTQSVDLLGSGVAVQGNTIVVGAWWHDTDELDAAGKAYVFRHDGSTWVEVDTLQAINPSPWAEFGYSVDLDQDRIVVGARIDNGLVNGGGAAFVFRETAPDQWTQEQKLVGSDVLPISQLGHSVTIEGDTVAFGSDAHHSAGFAFVYEHDGVQWVERARLSACDPLHRDGFGVAIDLCGDTLVVGASRRSVEVPSTGAAYRFAREGSNWTLVEKLVPSTLELVDQFGISVALDNGQVVIGADWSAAQAPQSGAAYTFDLEEGPGENFCELSPNSTDHPATLTATGSASVAAANLALRAYVVPDGQPGLFLYGANNAHLPFGDGFLCVSPFAPGLVRLPPTVVTPDNGVATRVIDYDALPAIGSITPGSTFYFQFWYRDPGGPGGTGFNLTNGLRITFQP